ncbi:hypothetical protein HOD38_05415 [archaeon]|jgi:hypothetical protein|nr:hypothetical protein [archaeon]MBT4397679.1 hypothetical protein [archaeon]MBT4441625.1 hypothetical protein [archaeon]
MAEDDQWVNVKIQQTSEGGGIGGRKLRWKLSADNYVPQTFSPNFSSLKLAVKEFINYLKARPNIVRARLGDKNIAEPILGSLSGSQLEEIKEMLIAHNNNPRRGM